MPKGNAKGSKFERMICGRLSLWWTEGGDDSAFWRTAGSGGRATRRARRGHLTRGHCGDICATDEAGQPLMDLITFELKRGYNYAALTDVMDRKPHILQREYEEWIEQASLSSDNSGTPYWAIVHQRDLQEALIVIPLQLYEKLKEYGAFRYLPGDSKFAFMTPTATFDLRIRKGNKSHKRVQVFVCKFDNFLKVVKPSHLRKMIADN